jgi:hypothetical protein
LAIAASQLAIVRSDLTTGKSQSTFGNHQSSIHNIKLAIIKSELPFDGCKPALRHIKLHPGRIKYEIPREEQK